MTWHRNNTWLTVLPENYHTCTTNIDGGVQVHVTDLSHNSILKTNVIWIHPSYICDIWHFFCHLDTKIQWERDSFICLIFYQRDTFIFRVDFQMVDQFCVRRTIIDDQKVKISICLPENRLNSLPKKMYPLIEYRHHNPNSCFRRIVCVICVCSDKISNMNWIELI